MGYSGLMLAARPGVSLDQARRTLDGRRLGPPTVVANGWIRATADLAGHDPTPTSLAEDLAGELAGPVALASVLASDLAVLWVAEPDRPGTELMMTERAARAYGARPTPKAERRAAIRAVADWSAVAPAPMTEADIRTVLRKHELFAEGRVEAFLEQLGLGYDYAASLERERWNDLPPPTPDAYAGLPGYRRPLPWMADGFVCFRRRVAWKEYRFVPGLGSGFIGIWDRDRSADPWRFEPSAKGMEALKRKLDELRRPLEIELVAAHELAGFLAVVPESEGELRPGERFILLRDARFVPGIGKGFVGVWDREAGPDPVVRFPGRSEASRWRAVESASAAMLRHLAAAKSVGPERWISVSPFADPDDPYAGVPCWLIVLEQSDRVWTLVGSDDDDSVLDSYWLYALGRDASGVKIVATEWSTDLSELKVAAARWARQNEWTLVPESVPATLLATAEWAMSEAPLVAGR